MKTVGYPHPVAPGQAGMQRMSTRGLITKYCNAHSVFQQCRARAGPGPDPPARWRAGLACRVDKQEVEARLPSLRAKGTGEQATFCQNRGYEKVSASLSTEAYFEMLEAPLIL